MTDIAVRGASFQVDDLSWDLTPPHGGFDQQGVIAVSAFTQAQHFPNGYIPAGTVLAIAASGGNTGKLVPYLNSGTGVNDTAVGILKASVTVVNQDGTTKAQVGAAYRVHGIVRVPRLPLTSGTAANGGYIDAAGQTDLKLIYFQTV